MTQKDTKIKGLVVFSYSRSLRVWFEFCKRQDDMNLSCQKFLFLPVRFKTIETIGFKALVLVNPRHLFFAMSPKDSIKILKSFKTESK